MLRTLKNYSRVRIITYRQSLFAFIIRRILPPNRSAGISFRTFRFPVLDKNIKQAVTPEGDADTFPLILMPKDSIKLAGGYIGTPPYLMKTVEDTVLKFTEEKTLIPPLTKYTVNWAGSDC